MRLGMRIEKILGRLVPDPALGLYSIVYSTVLLYTAIPCTRCLRYCIHYRIQYCIQYYETCSESIKNLKKNDQKVN